MIRSLPNPSHYYGMGFEHYYFCVYTGKTPLVPGSQLRIQMLVWPDVHYFAILTFQAVYCLRDCKDLHFRARHAPSDVCTDWSWHTGSWVLLLLLVAVGQVGIECAFVLECESTWSFIIQQGKLTGLNTWRACMKFNNKFLPPPLMCHYPNVCFSDESLTCTDVMLCCRTVSETKCVSVKAWIRVFYVMEVYC